MEIEKKLEVLFKKYTNISFDRDHDLKNKPLTGFELNLMPAVLVFILRQVELEYNIDISKSKVVQGHFNTFNNILKLITEV